MQGRQGLSVKIGDSEDGGCSHRRNGIKNEVDHGGDDPGIPKAGKGFHRRLPDQRIGALQKLKEPGIFILVQGGENTGSLWDLTVCRLSPKRVKR